METGFYWKIRALNQEREKNTFPLLKELLSDFVRQSVTRKSDEMGEAKEEMIISHLQSTNELVMKQVKSGMAVLKEKTLSFGRPSQNGKVVVKGKESNDLLFGNRSTGADFTIVDAVKDIVGGSATLFSHTGGEYIRISTNVQKDDGTRAVGTILNPNGKAIKKSITAGAGEQSQQAAEVAASIEEMTQTNYPYSPGSFNSQRHSQGSGRKSETGCAKS